MIRKRIVYIIISIFVFYGCEEAENPNKIPEDAPRLDEINANYMSILSSAEYGWKATYQPTNSYGAFNILMKFKENGTVELESDLNGYNASTDKVLYAVKGATFPELVFETFCVWHQIYDVAEGVFQFRIINMDGEQVRLSKVNIGATETEVTFTRATAADYVTIEKKQDIDSVLFNFYNNTEGNFKIADFSEQNIKGLVDFDFDTHQFYISYTDNNGVAQNKIANYKYDENGIVFVSPLVLNNLVIERFDVQTESDTIISFENSLLDKALIASTNLPDFEFQGAFDLFRQNTIYVLSGLSEEVDTIYKKTQVKAGAEIAIYQNYPISESTTINQLSFIIFETSGDYDWYDFDINAFQKLGEDRIRFRWSGSRSSNIDNELFLSLRDYVLFFFNKDGFKIIPTRGVFILVSYNDPQKYIVLTPVL